MQARPWIALVGPELEENLSLRYLAAALRKAGYAPRLLAFNGGGDLRKVAAAVLEAPEPPLFVGLSLAFQWRAQDFLALAMELRARGFAGHLTAGGHFATFATEELLRDFDELDSICRHEAEDTVVELARALSRRQALDKVLGLSHRSTSGQVVHNPARPPGNLSRLAPPERPTKPAEVFGHGIAPLVASRGCYANCTFCCIAAWHEQALPGRRYRLRPVEDVADEMAWLHHRRAVEVFVFQDDNFFLPRRSDSMERLSDLAGALSARGVRRFATIVKARPNDLDADLVHVLQHGLHCVRLYVGIETDSDQGLRTLRRGVRSEDNHRALAILRDAELFASFNLLLFDPDTTVESLEANLAFLAAHADFPFNFGRVELYAGTPLLRRMQLDGRAVGDYLQHDYNLATSELERIYAIASTAFAERNFGDGALANAMMATRIEVELCRHFHPEAYRSSFLSRGVELSRRLGLHSVATLEHALAHVTQGGPAEQDEAVAQALREEVRDADACLRQQARELAFELHQNIGVGTPLTDLSADVSSTPLLRAVLEAG